MGIKFKCAPVLGFINILLGKEVIRTIKGDTVANIPTAKSVHVYPDGEIWKKTIERKISGIQRLEIGDVIQEKDGTKTVVRYVSHEMRDGKATTTYTGLQSVTSSSWAPDGLDSERICYDKVNSRYEIPIISFPTNRDNAVWPMYLFRKPESTDLSKCISNIEIFLKLIFAFLMGYQCEAVDPYAWQMILLGALMFYLGFAKSKIDEIEKEL